MPTHGILRMLSVAALAPLTTVKMLLRVQAPHVHFRHCSAWLIATRKILVYILSECDIIYKTMYNVLTVGQ